MAMPPELERAQRALLLALSRNRGEIDPEKLRHVLDRLAEPRPAK
jgi:hypothetical protein